MSTGDKPAVARGRVRAALRKAREARHLTQTQVASAMDWSLSKVMRIESGEVSISAGDLQMLLPYLEITDSDEVDRLLAQAKVSRRQRWIVDRQYRRYLTPALVELIQFEPEALVVHYYNPVLLPGFLQTPDYAAAIFSSFAQDLDEPTISARVRARLQRREFVLTEREQPLYRIVLDESVLYRAVGGPAVMVEQLEDLVVTMSRSNVTIRILPFVAAAAAALSGPFLLLDMGDDQEAILYREAHLSDEIIRVTRTVAEHLDIFERLWTLGLDGTESMQLIKQRSDALKADRAVIDRQP
jgi:transcriptional regulator with XRE-family HTH domain